MLQTQRNPFEIWWDCSHRPPSTHIVCETLHTRTQAHMNRTAAQIKLLITHMIYKPWQCLRCLHYDEKFNSMEWHVYWPNLNRLIACASCPFNAHDKAVQSAFCKCVGYLHSGVIIITIRVEQIKSFNWMRMVVVANFAVVWIVWHIFLDRIPATEARRFTQNDLKSKWFEAVMHNCFVASDKRQSRKSHALTRAAIPNPFSI